MAGDFFECLPQLRADAAQFVPVCRREPRQQCLAPRRQPHLHAPVVVPGRYAPHQGLPDEPIHETNRTVGAHAQLHGQLAYADRVAAGKTLDGEEGLVLLGRKPGGARGRGAKLQKTPQGMAEGRQRLVFGDGRATGGAFLCGHAASVVGSWRKSTW
jgi:hypothetical protein